MRIATVVSAEDSNPSLRPFTLARIVAIPLLVLAVAPWPYGYYLVLRLVACAVTAYGAFVAVKLANERWAWTFGLIALLFNPFLPIHLPRELWVILDLGVGGVLAASFFYLRKGQR